MVYFFVAFRTILFAIGLFLSFVGVAEAKNSNGWRAVVMAIFFILLSILMPVAQ